MTDAEIAAQTAKTRVPDLWMTKPTGIVQETTNVPVTDRHANDLSVSAKDVEILHDNKRLYVAHCDAQKMNDAAVFRYEGNSLRRLSYGMIWNTLETHFNIAAKGPAKEILNPIYRAAEEFVKQAVRCGEADHAISSRLARPAESQLFAKTL